MRKYGNLKDSEVLSYMVIVTPLVHSGLVSTVTQSRRNGGGGAPNDPPLGSAVASPTATSHQTETRQPYEIVTPVKT